METQKVTLMKNDPRYYVRFTDKSSENLPSPEEFKSWFVERTTTIEKQSNKIRKEIKEARSRLKISRTENRKICQDIQLQKQIFQKKIRASNSRDNLARPHFGFKNSIHFNTHHGRASWICRPKDIGEDVNGLHIPPGDLKYLAHLSQDVEEIESKNSSYLSEVQAVQENIDILKQKVQTEVDTIFEILGPKLVVNLGLGSNEEIPSELSKEDTSKNQLDIIAETLRRDSIAKRPRLTREEKERAWREYAMYTNRKI